MHVYAYEHVGIEAGIWCLLLHSLSPNLLNKISHWTWRQLAQLASSGDFHLCSWCVGVTRHTAMFGFVCGYSTHSILATEFNYHWTSGTLNLGIGKLSVLFFLPSRPTSAYRRQRTALAFHRHCTPFLSFFFFFFELTSIFHWPVTRNFPVTRSAGWLGREPHWSAFLCCPPQCFCTEVLPPTWPARNGLTGLEACIFSYLVQQIPTTMSWFVYMGWGLNLWPSVCKANNLLTSLFCF